MPRYSIINPSSFRRVRHRRFLPTSTPLQSSWYRSARSSPLSSYTTIATTTKNSNINIIIGNNDHHNNPHNCTPLTVKISNKMPLPFSRQNWNTSRLVPFARIFSSSTYHNNNENNNNDGNKNKQDKKKSSENSYPLLKTMLRKFFLRVHPDRFEQYPEQKLANTESFKLLTSLIDSMNQKRIQPNQEMKFHFYLFDTDKKKQPPSSPSTSQDIISEHDADDVVMHERDEASSSSSPSPSSTSSPPPAFTEIKTSCLFTTSDTRSTQVMTQVKETLSLLFEGAGLDPKFSFGDAFERDPDDNDYLSWVHAYQSATLTSFMNDHHRVAAELTQANRFKQTNDAPFLLTGFRMRGVRILFQGQGIDQPLQFKALECFKRVTEASSFPNPMGFPVDANTNRFGNVLAGLQPHSVLQKKNNNQDEGGAPQSPFARVVHVFCSHSRKSRVDERGRLVYGLNQDDWDDEWSRFLEPGVFDLAKQKSSQWHATKTLETQVAKASGIYDIFCQAKLTGNLSYLAFLNRLEKEASLFADLFDSSPSYTELRQLPLYIQEEESSSSSSTGVWFDPTMGYLIASMQDSPSDICNRFRSVGLLALKTHKDHVAAAEDFKHTTLQAKRKLKVRTLERIPDRVSKQQFRDCCEKLLYIHPKLQRMFVGLHVRIDSRYDFDEHGWVTIPYNFRA